MARSAQRDIMALLQQGLAHHRVGQLQQAKAAYQKVLKIEPREPNANRFLGVVYMQTGETAAARKHIEAAAKSAPHDAENQYYLARLAIDDLRHDDARAAIAACLRIDPRHANARILDAAVELAHGRYELALEKIDAALKLQPRSVDALCNKVDILQALNRTDDAWAVVDAAVALAPRSPDVLLRRGKLHVADRSQDAAYLDFRWASQADPNRHEIRLQLASAAIAVAAWDDVRKNLDAMVAARTDQHDAASYFNLFKIAWRASAETLLDQARRDLPAVVEPLQAPPLVARRGDRLRIGYVSSDLNGHPVGQLFRGVIANHDRSAYDIVNFSILPDDPKDKVRQEIQANCTEVHFVDALRGKDFAEFVQKQGIDVAVEMNGWTAHSYIHHLCFRPAPVQMAYLGYPGTTGAGFIDYIVGDRSVIPPGHEAEFAEKPIRLPYCYLPFDRDVQPEPDVPTRAECGFPDDAIVFSGYNGAYKLTDDLADSWARIMQRVPGSVLWLRHENDLQAANLQREFAARGIDPSRVVPARRSESFARHIGRQSHCALFLDSFYYNAHTTGMDSLWAGVPIVTKVGPTFAGRVGASLLRCLGLDELVTTTVEDYEETAVRLALDPAALADLRRRLAAAKATSPLFDSRQQARHLEWAYREAFERHARGEAPAAFDVPDLTGAGEAGQAGAGR